MATTQSQPRDREPLVRGDPETGVIDSLPFLAGLFPSRATASGGGSTEDPPDLQTVGRGIPTPAGGRGQGDVTWVA